MSKGIHKFCIAVSLIRNTLKLTYTGSYKRLNAPCLFILVHVCLCVVLSRKNNFKGMTSRYTCNLAHC